MIAYLLLVHRYPEQFKRLFKSVYHPANTYLVHVDQNSPTETEAQIRRFLAPYANSAVMEGRKVLWGGYSLVEAQLRGMAQLLDMAQDWKHFINLSGQDFPLKSQNYIMDYLARRPGKEFIRVLDQQLMRPDTMARIQRYAVELEDGIVRTTLERGFLEGAVPYIGNQWMIASRRFCRFVCHDPRAQRFKSFYRNTFIADEGFFQTVMMNTGAHGDIANDDLRAIDWIPDGDIKLRPRTFTLQDSARLLSSGDLFARKFDAAVDSGILDLLEAHLTPARPAVRTIAGALAPALS